MIDIRNDSFIINQSFNHFNFNLDRPRLFYIIFLYSVDLEGLNLKHFKSIIMRK